MQTPSNSEAPLDIDEQAEALRYLFHSRRKIENLQAAHESFRINAKNGKDTPLMVSVGWFTHMENSDGAKILKPVSSEADIVDGVVLPRLVINFGENTRIAPLDVPSTYSPTDQNIVSQFISASGRSNFDLNGMWSAVEMTSREKDVINALRLGRAEC